MIDRSLDGLAMIEAKLPAGEIFSQVRFVCAAISDTHWAGKTTTKCCVKTTNQLMKCLC